MTIITYVFWGKTVLVIKSNSSLVYCKVPRGGWGRQSEGRAQQQWLWDVLLTDHGKELMNSSLLAVNRKPVLPGGSGSLLTINRQYGITGHVAI